MTLLLNWALPIILAVITLVFYFVHKAQKDSFSKLRVFTAYIVAVVGITLVYNGIQTTYLPKGSAKPMPIVVIEAKDIEIKDITVKPKERDMNEIITVKDEVKQILQ